MSTRTLGLGIQAFQSDCANRAEQSLKFAKDMKAEVLSPIRMMIKDQEGMVRSLSLQAEKLRKEIESIASNIGATYQNYLIALKEAEDTLFECEDYRKKAPEKLKADPCIAEKLNVKMMNSLKLHKEALTFYTKFSEAAGSRRVKHEAELKSFLEVLEEQERQRIEVVKSSLAKILVFEASIEKSRQYDIEKANVPIEEIDARKDIDALIHSATVYTQIAKEQPANCALKKTGWDRLFEVYAKNYYIRGNVPVDYEVVVEETKNYILHVENEEFKQNYEHFRQILRELIKEGKGLAKEVLDSLKAILKNSKGRIAFADALKEETTGKEGVSLTAEAFRALSNLLWTFLTQAQQELDLPRICSIMSTSRSLTLSANKALTLLLATRDHTLWKDANFWSASVKHVVGPVVRLQRTAQCSALVAGCGWEGEKSEKLVGVVKDALELFGDKEALKKVVLEFLKVYGFSIQSIDEIMVIVCSYCRRL